MATNTLRGASKAAAAVSARHPHETDEAACDGQKPASPAQMSKSEGVVYSPFSNSNSNSSDNSSSSSSSSKIPVLGTASLSPEKVRLPVPAVPTDPPSVGGGVVLPSSRNRARPRRHDAPASASSDNTSCRGNKKTEFLWVDNSLREAHGRAVSLSETTPERIKDIFTRACEEAVEVQAAEGSAWKQVASMLFVRNTRLKRTHAATHAGSNALKLKLEEAEKRSSRLDAELREFRARKAKKADECGGASEAKGTDRPLEDLRLSTARPVSRPAQLQFVDYAQSCAPTSRADGVSAALTPPWDGRKKICQVELRQSDVDAVQPRSSKTKDHGLRQMSSPAQLSAASSMATTAPATATREGQMSMAPKALRRHKVDLTTESTPVASTSFSANVGATTTAACREAAVADAGGASAGVSVAASSSHSTRPRGKVRFAGATNTSPVGAQATKESAAASTATSSTAGCSSSSMPVSTRVGARVAHEPATGSFENLSTTSSSSAAPVSRPSRLQSVDCARQSARTLRSDGVSRGQNPSLDSEKEFCVGEGRQSAADVGASAAAVFPDPVQPWPSTVRRVRLVRTHPPREVGAASFAAAAEALRGASPTAPRARHRQKISAGISAHVQRDETRPVDPLSSFDSARSYQYQQPVLSPSSPVRGNGVVQGDVESDRSPLLAVAINEPRPMRTRTNDEYDAFATRHDVKPRERKTRRRNSTGSKSRSGTTGRGGEDGSTTVVGRGAADSTVEIPRRRPTRRGAPNVYGVTVAPCGNGGAQMWAGSGGHTQASLARSRTKASGVDSRRPWV